MITERDNTIIKEWFEPYSYGSIRQIEQAFFKDQEYSYNITSRRLKEMNKNDYLAIYHDEATNKNIYVYKNKNVRMKAPTQSRMLLLDLLSELMYMGLEIKKYEIEKFWMDGKIRSDAFLQCTLGNVRLNFFVEVQLASHPNNLEKYNALYESKEVQHYIGKDVFPRIIFITDTDYGHMDVKYTEVIKLNTKLDQLCQILIRRENK